MIRGSIHQKDIASIHILHANPKYVPSNREKYVKQNLIKLKE